MSHLQNPVVFILSRGNFGSWCIGKVSAVDPQHRVVEAPAMVFDDQDDAVAAFKNGELERDVIVVLRFQGPKSNGMPELHKLSSPLGVLQDRGFKVALVTDGRMSGASGKVPSAIQMCPESADGGPLTRIKDGDIIHLDTENGIMNVLVDDEEFNARLSCMMANTEHHYGSGRELFDSFRAGVSSAEEGAINMFNVE